MPLSQYLAALTIFLLTFFACQPRCSAIDASDFEISAKAVRVQNGEISRIGITAKVVLKTDSTVSMNASKFYFAEPYPQGWTRKPRPNAIFFSDTAKQVTLSKDGFIMQTLVLKDFFSTLSAGNATVQVAIGLLIDGAQSITTISVACPIDVLAGDL